jgi:hypothetical protein
MIHLSRSFDAGDPSAAAFFGEVRIDRLVELAEMARAAEFAWDSKKWKPAKELLKAESNGKCAYCDASTETVAYGDVEHFRPKSVYWWLAYCYDNYLFSCQICNQGYKKDHFPTAGPHLTAPVLPRTNATRARLRAAVARFTPDPVDDASGLARSEFIRLLKNERPLLPDPYLEDPEALFTWSADPVLKEVEIRPRSPAEADRHAAVQQYFGLNRDELKRWRWSVYKKLEMLREIYQTGTPPQAEQNVKNVIRAYLQDTEPFAAMSRYFVNEVWKLTL